MSGYSYTLTVQTNQLNKSLALVFGTLIKAEWDEEDIAILYLIMLISIYSQIRVVDEDYFITKGSHFL